MIEQEFTMIQSLAQYLTARNETTLAWVAEAPTTRCAFLITENLAYWAEVGVETVEQFEFYIACSTYSDVYKDVYGGRPRGYFPETLEELNLAIERLQETLQFEIESERERDEERMEEMGRLEREYEEQFTKQTLELAEYREAQVWANFQEGWI
jgi:hypothetical protein